MLSSVGISNGIYRRNQNLHITIDKF